MVDMLWMANYKKIDIISRLNKEKYVYCPIVINNELHIAKTKILKMEKDVADYYASQSSETNLRCNVEIYRKVKLFKIFNYIKTEKIEGLETIIIGNSVLDTLKRALNIFKDSSMWNTVKLSPNLEYIVIKENLNNLEQKKFEYGINMSKLNKKLFFNEFKEEDKNYNKLAI